MLIFFPMGVIMSSIFITFGGGGHNYIQAGERLIHQEENTYLFDELILYTDHYLKSDTSFWNKHGEFIENNKRGYGYWIWKPYIIKKTMEKMQDGDILLYLDSGCEIDIRKTNVIRDYFDLAYNEYIIGTHIAIENGFNKMDTLLYIDAIDDNFLNTPQNQAGALLFYVCDKTRVLVNEWYDICCYYHMIDDTESLNKNLDSFVEHRHDQSVFSLLTKKYGVFSNKYSLFNCIEYVRNKSRNSIIC